MGKPELCPYCDGVVERTELECPHCHRRLTGRALLENPPHVVRAAATVLPDVDVAATTKRCPFCAEEIQAAATICRFCQRDVSSAPTPASGAGLPRSADDRRSILGQQIERAMGPGMRVESRGDFQAVLVRGTPTNHLLHFLVGVFTIGAWWIVWLFIAATNRVTHRLITVDEFGVARAKDY